MDQRFANLEQGLSMPGTPGTDAQMLEIIDDSLEQAADDPDLTLITLMCKMGGEIAERLGEDERALAYYTRFTSNIQHDPYVYQAMGTICLKKGDLKAAVTHFKAYYELCQITPGFKGQIKMLKRLLNTHGLKLEDLEV